MNIEIEHIFLSFAGLATTPALISIAIRAALYARRRNYTRAKITQSRLSLPRTAPTRRTIDELQSDDAVKELLSSEHSLAKTLQDKTIAHLVGASTGLFVAFAMTAASVTILANIEFLHLYSAMLDISALIAVFIAYRRSVRIRAAWINQRIVTEFLRQWAAVDYLLIPDARGVTKRTEEVTSRIKGMLAERKDDGLEATLRVGEERAREFRQGIIGQPAIPVERLAVFLARRPLRQARWFSASVNRLSGQDKRRRRLMQALFAAALVAAGTKLAALFFGLNALAEFAAFTILLAISIGGASTSMYLGQNLRSIHHRYVAQLQTVKDWINEHDELCRRTSDPRPLTGDELVRLASAVAAFESLMLMELVDWIAIAADDAMEIGPV